MKTILICITAILVVSCAQQPERTELWRWVGEGSGGDAKLYRDRAQCRHEWRTTGNQQSFTYQVQGAGGYNQGFQNMANAMGGGMPPAFMWDCLAAKGWEFVGYE